MEHTNKPNVYGTRDIHLPSTDALDMPALAAALSQTLRISYTNHSRDWRQNLKLGQKKLHNIFQTLKSSFAMENRYLFIPDRKIIIGSHRNSNLIKICLKKIDSLHSGCNTIVIGSTAVLTLFSCDNLCKPKDHILDILTVDERWQVCIWVICENPDLTSQTQYARSTGRLLKKLLVEINCDQRDFMLSIQSKVFTKHGVQRPTRLEKRCVEYFTGDHQDWKNLQLRVVMLLLKKKTHIRSRFGDYIMINLSAEQITPLIESDLAKTNIIEGPAGSGKTIMIIYLCKEVFTNDYSLVLCSNPCLKCSLDYQEVALTKVIQNDKDLEELLKTDIFKAKRCIMIDDAHNIPLSKSAWYQLFEKVHQCGNHLFVFSDNKIQSYQPSANQANFMNALDTYENSTNGFYSNRRYLSTIHRNSLKVAAFLSTSASDKKLTCSHDEEGDDVEVRRLQNIYADNPENDLLKLFDSLTDAQKLLAGDPAAYEPKNIAILVDGPNAEAHIRFFRRLFADRAQGAETFPVKAAVIDHVKRFAGLDAQLVILVAPERFINEDTELGIHNDRYRAFLASRGIYRVIFVLDSVLHPGIMTSMGTDYMPGISR